MEAQSTESSGFYNFLAWLEVNKKRVLIGLVVAAVLAIAIAAYSWNKEQAEMDANQALFSLNPGFAAGKATPDADKYDQIAKSHPNTSAAERAELLAATATFTGGDYAKAEQQFQAFLNNYGKSELRPQALMGVAAALEAQGKTDAALAKYEDINKQYSKEAVASQAKLAIGRLNESKNPEKAAQMYAELSSSEMVADAWRSEAMSRREKLLVLHPDLGKEVLSEQIIEVTTPPDPGATSTATNK